MAMHLYNGSLMAPWSSVAVPYCGSYYASMPKGRDCVKAVSKLGKGSNSVTYTVDGDHGQHNLPLYTESGQRF